MLGVDVDTFSVDASFVLSGGKYIAEIKRDALTAYGIGTVGSVQLMLLSVVVADTAFTASINIITDNESRGFWYPRTANLQHPVSNSVKLVSDTDPGDTTIVFGKHYAC